MSGITGTHAVSGTKYVLRFGAEKGRAPTEIEFEAPSAYQALIIAHREARSGSAELWRDGKRLCFICERGGSFWEIQPCAGEPTMRETPRPPLAAKTGGTPA
jgi:hypothetical protein